MNGTRTCTVDSCDNKFYARGWCKNHYNTGIRAMSPADGIPGCAVDGCEKAHYGKGYCRLHWERNLRHGDPNKRIKLYGTSIAERLSTYSRQVGECIEWTGRLTRSGYGQIVVNKRSRTAHRVAFELAHGSIPDGLVVRHKCDNPKCLSLAHLELGTFKDNSQDMVKRGRSLVGTRNHAAKLDFDKAEEIRAFVSAGNTYDKAAKRFGVGSTTISRVMRRVVWAER